MCMIVRSLYRDLHCMSCLSDFYVSLDSVIYDTLFIGDPIGSQITVTIWNVVFANKSWKLGFG